MPVIQRKGAQSSQGFGEFAQSSTAANYIEDVFSTYLYTGNGSTQTITNGIDLSTKGGLVWIKDRTFASNHRLFDTSNGVNQSLLSNLTLGLQATANSLTAFNSSGFSVGTSAAANASGTNYASWTFRKQAKFFDIVTYTGNGTARTIAHNLGSVPGCIIIKAISGTNAGSYNWSVYHRSLATNQALTLDLTNGVFTSNNYWNNTAPTSTVFSLGTHNTVNNSACTYVAYLFAHDAGGFGLTGTDNVISCGSFTTDASGNASVTLGYEPQWVLLKSTATSSWAIMDNMRGMPVTANSSTTTGGRLYPNLSNADDGFPMTIANATGFTTVPGTIHNSETYIYIAIRRGPMKTPTVGTSVFSPIINTGTGSNATLTSNFPPDSVWQALRTAGTGYTYGFAWSDRLRGNNNYLLSGYGGGTQAEALANQVSFDSIYGTFISNNSVWQASGRLNISYAYGRAPGFFDEVCFTSASGVQTQSHNLNVVPELMILKTRNTTGNWRTYSSLTGISNSLFLNANNASTAGGGWSSAPTSSVFTYTGGTTVAAPYDCVAYLFASCPGVSKVGSYTGTGATQTINCGFTGGARFVLIKRTDTTGDWYVWDTARGMVSGTDPYLLIDTDGAEVNANNVYTTSVGFQIVGTGAGINASGGTYLYLAVA